MAINQRNKYKYFKLFLYICLLFAETVNCVHVNKSAIVVQDHRHNHQQHDSHHHSDHHHPESPKHRYRSKFTIEQLLTTKFPSKMSNDIDMDPCKAGGFMGDIALPDIDYELSQWQSAQYNKTFQQELEILKKEVYHEGLQVEEEGLTDIIRKKTKIPNTNYENSNGSNKNDAILNEPYKEVESKLIKKFKSEPNRGHYQGVIISEEENISYHPKIIIPELFQVYEKSESFEKYEKPTQTSVRNIDHRKIQSNTKDIIDDSGKNFISQKKLIILPISEPTVSGSEADSKRSSYEESLEIERSNKRHSRRRQRRKLNQDSDEYKEKFERLKEELTKPVITTEEIRQKYRPSQEIFLNSKSFNKYSNKKFNIKKINYSSENVDVLDVLTKRRSTMKAMDAELDASFPGVNIHDEMEHIEHHHRVARAVTAKKERIWDYGVIPYEIDGNFSGSHKALFKQAMRHWENSTCIKFVERVPELHPNYIIFTVRNCGCCSFVGKRGNGGQAISIGRNCDKFGIVVHELGHVVGFWHEHTRPDREKHVTIELSNIMKGQDYNFNMLTSEDVNSLGMSYDYDSIMHYARNTFSKGTYLDTILPIEIKGKKRPEIGQRLRLSIGDISQANLLYKCPKCGRTFQENTGNLSSPYFNSTIYPNETERCEWRITATHGERIVLYIKNLNLLKSEDCQTDYLEIRDGYWFKSPLIGRFCGKMSLENVTTVSSRMLLTYVNSHRYLGYRGFDAHFEAICGGELNIETDGRLESPNYPLDYLPNKECIWKITVPENYQVALKFQSFEVENHDNCTYDYVEVRDGDTADARLIGVFCGYKPPPNMKSSSNKMFVKFVSDPSVQKAGFSAIFMKEVDECETQDHGCEHECINTLGGYECSCFIGYELHSDKKSCEDACGGIIEALNGTITSPSFPDVYPMSKECIWEIIAPPRHKILLNFTDFELEGNSHQHIDCGYDHVAVYSKLSENRLKHIGTFCGTKIPSMITSEGNALRIVFHSDKSVQRRGFAAVFFTDIDECASDNGGCEQECKNTIGSYICSCNNGYTLHENGHDCKEGECKYEITAPNGNIYSPNYPDLYPPNLDCVWRFATTPGHRIKLIFNIFDIESHPECSYDHVVIYDGGSDESMSAGRFCGDKIPYPISASSNELYMILKSDQNKQRKGFVATHSTACGGYLRATNQIKNFYSHANYGYQNYNENMDCDWTIQADPGSNVQLFFLKFEIEESVNCSCDYVEVYAGMEDTSGPLYGRYCGNNNPPDIISLEDSLLVRFKTDDTMSKRGFSASYIAVDPFENSEEMSSDSSELVTPFPGSLKSVFKSAEYDEYGDYNENGLVNRHRPKKTNSFT